MYHLVDKNLRLKFALIARASFQMFLIDRKHCPDFAILSADDVVGGAVAEWVDDAVTEWVTLGTTYLNGAV